MAYHTRRSGPQGMGRGTPPPMMFQQQRSNNRTSNFGSNRNGNPNQPPNNYQGNASQSQSNNTNYAQQPQPQQQVQPQPQQQVQPQPQQQVQPQPQQQVQTQPQQQVQSPAQIPVKQEPQSNEDQMQSSLSGALVPPPPPPAMLLDPNDSLVSDIKSKPEENGEIKLKPWMKSKIPGFKVNKRLRRRRQNARLRKMLQPKNAITLLNELKAGIKFTSSESINTLTQTMFVVHAEIEGKMYLGQGFTRANAKNMAAEDALKDILCKHMTNIALKASSEESYSLEEMNVAMSGVDDDESIDGLSTDEDDLPWGSIASFALFKLFNEWQNQPSQVTQVPQVPLPKTSTGLPNPLVSYAHNILLPTTRKLPTNPTEKHPVMLLNQLRPGVEFMEISREGMPPNVVFTMSVLVDGLTYKGVAKNKKDAKKEAAKAALAATFNIKYD